VAVKHLARDPLRPEERAALATLRRSAAHTAGTSLWRSCHAPPPAALQARRRGGPRWRGQGRVSVWPRAGARPLCARTERVYVLRVEAPQQAPVREERIEEVRRRRKWRPGYMQGRAVRHAPRCATPPLPPAIHLRERDGRMGEDPLESSPLKICLPSVQACRRPHWCRQVPLYYLRSAKSVAFQVVVKARAGVLIRNPGATTRCPSQHHDILCLSRQMSLARLCLKRIWSLLRSMFLRSRETHTVNSLFRTASFSFSSRT